MTKFERIQMIQELQDRLLYLEGESRAEFLDYLDILFTAYPSPRKVYYGAEAIQNQIQCTTTKSTTADNL